MDDRVVAAVTTTQPEPDRLETLLRRLLSGPVVPSLPPEPALSALEQLLQGLLMEAQAPRQTPPAQTGHSDIESLLWSLLPGTSAPAAWAQPGPIRWNWNTVVCFSCGKAGHVPVSVAGVAGREGGQQLCYDIPPGGGRAEPGGKRRLIWGMGSTTRISNGTRTQDPGGGEVQLAASRDVAVARRYCSPSHYRRV